MAILVVWCTWRLFGLDCFGCTVPTQQLQKSASVFTSKHLNIDYDVCTYFNLADFDLIAIKLLLMKTQESLAILHLEDHLPLLIAQQN